MITFFNKKQKKATGYPIAFYLFIIKFSTNYYKSAILAIYNFLRTESASFLIKTLPCSRI